MYRTLTHRRRWTAGIVAAVGIAGTVGVVGVPSASASVPSKPGTVGIECSNGEKSGGVRTFALETDADYITLPDGNTTYMYGYKNAGGHFQHPSPVLCADQGDVVVVTLKNTLHRATSIVFPGQDNVLANGLPAAPEAIDSVGDSATPGSPGSTLTSLTTTAAKDAGTVTYQFTAGRPGTFLYESGTEGDLQVRMGLFGALIVHPSSGVDFAYNRTDTQFTTKANTGTGAYNDEEFLVLLSEIDPYLNQAVQASDDANGATVGFDFATYHPRYWLINGRGFPDSIADNHASWLPNQPYGALAEMRPMSATHTHPGLTRYLNVGTETYPFHPHGNNGRVIGRDGNPLAVDAGNPLSGDMSYEKFAVDIGPGQTYDVLSSWKDDQQYSTSNPVPVAVPQVANQIFGMFYSGSPYLGVSGTLPPGQQTLNQCGEFYIIAHNHALYQITSWGVNMTGPITYMRIDPDPSASAKPGCPKA